MAELIRMPRMSDTMTEAVIVEWHKKVGDMVKPGDVLAEVETDKATMELESYSEGSLLYIGVEKGKSVLVNGVLAIVGKAGEDYKSLLETSAIITETVTLKEEKKEIKSDTAAPPTTVAPAMEKSDLTTPVSAAPASVQPLADNNGRIKISPLAKKLAKDKGIELGQISGSGDGGRIIKKDVDQYKAGSAQVTIPVFTESTEESYTDLPLSQMRKAIARRLTESSFSAPHFFLTMEVNMDNAINTRKSINEFSGVKISFNDFIIKACAMALREHPAVNSSWMGDFIRQNNHIHIGSAVAIPDGLIVPVIRFADQKTVIQIAAEAKELYGKARDKKLELQEFSGNTFTISNLGMMDIEEFTAIINPPDSCIMAVGKIKETVIKKENGFDVTQVMKITLSCDHRSVDGAKGAAFLQTFKKIMENPVAMLL